MVAHGHTAVGWLVRTFERHPDQLALSDGVVHWTFADLHSHAAAVEERLRSAGVASGEVVAVAMDRSPMQVAAVIGAALAGCVYVPLDPMQPRSRISSMLESSGARAVLTEDAGRLHPHLSHVDVPELPAIDPTTSCERREPAGSDGAYIVFTSGSTGEPKGVLVEHRSLQNLLEWTVRWFDPRPGRRSSMNVSVAFDASVWEIWCTLPAGAALLIPPERTRLSPTALRRWILDQSIDFCFVPTRMGEALLQQHWPADTALDRLIVGGEQLRRFPAPVIPFDVVNVYGPTEATVYTTFEIVERREDQSGCPPIGRPLDNVEVHVLDRHGDPVPTGAVGELYIGGMGVARGYVNNAELTAERFVVGPHGKRMYRSGDLVSRRADRRLLFHGREDRQVKVGGARVEIGEVEAAILRSAVVSNVGVVAWPSKAGLRLAAYVELRDRVLATERDLRAWTTDQLPAHMVPNTFVILGTLPVNRNGKLDHNVLPRPRWATAGDPVVGAAARH